MKNLKVPFLVSLVVVCAAGTWGARTLNAQQPGFKRVELERHDIGNPGHEAVLARGEFNAGAAAPKHTHPGEEVGYVLEGQVVLEVEGKPPATLQAGDVFFIPAGTVHSAKNGGANPAKVLSTYILEKGKPLATPVK
jgi:quercetin dioxygenase-like cupin family protein